MIDLVIQGIHGRMGRALRTLIDAREDCRVVAGVDTAARESDVPVFPSLAACDVHADVLIDFSNAAVTDATLDACVQKGLPCVLCTTGLSEQTLQHIEQAAAHIAIFKSANMSLGVNVLIALAKKANALLGSAYDIEIIEKHHHSKLDAPSGTALMIADAIKDAADTPYHYMYDRHAERRARDTQEIGLHAVRGGSIVGEHDVLFCGPNEVLTLSHSAQSRDVFANGAVNAAVFLAGKPAGCYDMEDLITV